METNDLLDIYRQRFRALVDALGLEPARQHVLGNCIELLSLAYEDGDAKSRRSYFRCINVLSAVILLDAQEREAN